MTTSFKVKGIITLRRRSSEFNNFTGYSPQQIQLCVYTLDSKIGDGNIESILSIQTVIKNIASLGINSRRNV